MKIIKNNFFKKIEKKIMKNILTVQIFSGISLNINRAVSSAGRAPALQAGCHQFDPGTAQQTLLLVYLAKAFSFC
jgi:hypothetical protein